MPVKHLRVCPEPCGKTRFAPCSPTCRAPDPHNPNNWQKHPSWDNPEDTNP